MKYFYLYTGMILFFGILTGVSISRGTWSFIYWATMAVVYIIMLRGRIG